MEKKYYFAVGNYPAALLSIIIPISTFFKGIALLTAMTMILFPVFYMIFIHTSITLNLKGLRIKTGFRIETIIYEDIKSIHEGLYTRPFTKHRKAYPAHIIKAKDIGLIGIEHYMYTPSVARQISKEIFRRKEISKKLIV